MTHPSPHRLLVATLLLACAGIGVHQGMDSA